MSAITSKMWRIILQETRVQATRGSPAKDADLDFALTEFAMNRAKEINNDSLEIYRMLDAMAISCLELRHRIRQLVHES